jgi:histidine triad (HIT) family protein
MTEPCIFCQIAAGNIPAEIVYQDDQAIAFRDLQPASPVHILVIPRQHLDSLNQANPQDEALLGHLLLIASRLAKEFAVDQSGYRLMINTGPDAGQSVFHLHVHLLGGKPLNRQTR